MLHVYVSWYIESLSIVLKVSGITEIRGYRHKFSFKTVGYRVESILETRFLRNQEKERKFGGREEGKEIKSERERYVLFLSLIFLSLGLIFLFLGLLFLFKTCATLALLCMILIIFLLEFYGQMYSFELIRILKPGENKLEYEGGSCQTKRWVGSFINGKWK